MMKSIILKLALYAFVISTSFVSCGNDEFFGFEDENNSWINKLEVIRQEKQDMSDYLTVSSFNPEEWSDSEFMAFSAAAERMGLRYSETKKQYEFEVCKGSDINISDTLFNVVNNLFGHSNMIMSSKDTQKKRIKTNNREMWWKLPNCGPAAVAHMGLCAPSYSTAIEKCNEMFPNWIQNGGIPRDSLVDYIREFVYVTRYHSMFFCHSNVVTLNNVVMFFCPQYPNGHIVNVYKYIKWGSVGTLYYHDYSSTTLGDGTILESQMLDIYPFLYSSY
ncbi:MAG: hypothetical protein IKZ89_00750 [Bacteroidaceae bacterium]|nr:hypothetical protein [Bacteroidaceae bacterium]